jgi:Rieske Fe-S protein
MAAQQRQDMLMMMQTMQSQQPQQDNQFQQYILEQQKLAQEQANALMQKLLENAQAHKAENSLQEFVNTANTFNKAKDALVGTLGIATGNPEVPEAVKEGEDLFQNIEKIASVFNLGSLTEAISSRIGAGPSNGGGAPRPPTVAPLANQMVPPNQIPVQTQVQQIPVQQVEQMPVQQVPMQQQPQTIQTQVQTVDQQQAQVPVQPPVSSDLNLSAGVQELLQAIEDSITNDIEPDQLLALIPEEAMARIRQLGKEEFVDMVQSSASPQMQMIQSPRGKKWLMKAKTIIYAPQATT